MIKEPIERLFNWSTFYKLRSPSDRRRAYLLLTPQYLNYGDHAIAWAEEQYLKDILRDFEFIEITYSFYEFWPEKFEKVVRPNDILLITGGGYMGDLWPQSQALVNRIVQTFPKNTTVILPQSIYFSSVGTDNELFIQTREIFLRHTDLWLFTREEYSFRMVTQHFLPEKQDRCFLVPDIVMWLTEQRCNVDRKNALLIFRTDRERVVVPELVQQIVAYLGKKRVPCHKVVMMRQHAEIPVALRKVFLDYKLRQYAGARLIITDRLHGMLFAYITRTPCLVFDNISRKVSGVHHWIKDCSWIQIAREDWQTQLEILLKYSLVTCEGIDTGENFEALCHLLDKIQKIKLDK